MTNKEPLMWTLFQNRRKPKTLLSLVALSLVALMAAGIVALLSRDSGTQAYGEHAYTDEDLGVQEMVDSFVARENRYARHRTDDEASAQRDQEDDWFTHVATGHERERRWFELQMRLVLWAASENLPQHLGEHGLLAEAFREALDECAASMGYPGVRLYDDPDVDPERLQYDGLALAAEREAEFERYEREYGLDYDSFVDLRHQCHQYAEDYPTLAVDERDSLLNERNDHFVRAIQRIVADLPEHAVPVEWHPGAPQPWEDQLIENCRAAAEGDQAILEECATELRIDVPTM